MTVTVAGQVIGCAEGWCWWELTAVLSAPGGPTVRRRMEADMPESCLRRLCSAAAASTVRYFGDVGTLDDPRTRDSFAAAGLIAAT